MKQLIKTEKDRELFIQRIKEVKLDKPYVAEFKVFQKKRSLSQNNLFWMWLRCIKDETGNDLDTLHDYFCRQYLGWYTENVFGQEVRQSKGTSELNTKEFTEFMENIKMEMHQEQGIFLPMPGDEGYEQFIARYGEPS